MDQITRNSARSGGQGGAPSVLHVGHFGCRGRAAAPRGQGTPGGPAERGLGKPCQLGAGAQLQGEGGLGGGSFRRGPWGLLLGAAVAAPGVGCGHGEPS